MSNSNLDSLQQFADIMLHNVEDLFGALMFILDEAPNSYAYFNLGYRCKFGVDHSYQPLNSGVIKDDNKVVVINSLDPESLIEAINAFYNADAGEQKSIDGSMQTQPFMPSITKYLNNEVQAFEHKAEVDKISTTCVYEERIRVFVSKDGVVKTETVRYCYVTMKVSKFGINGFAYDGELIDSDSFDIKPTLERCLQTALKEVEFEVEGEKIDSIEGIPFIIKATASDACIHEICHFFEGDVFNYASFLSNEQINQQISSEEVTLISDATKQGWYGSLEFDDEGIDTAPLTLIKKGVLKNIMHSKMNGGNSNGHARAPFANHPAKPRMFNTYMAAGKNDAKELMNNTAKAIIVDGIRGCCYDVDGKIELSFFNVSLVEDGKVVKKLKPLTVKTNLLDFLSGICNICDDLPNKAFAGSCGKYEDHPDFEIYVGSVTPTYMVKEGVFKI